MNQRTSVPAPTKPVGRDAAEITGRDRQFLPAALEILETPPPPLPVVIMLTICVFFSVALAWSFFGRLNVYAVARGKVETAGHAKVIQPLDPGKVAAIYVKDGQRVKAGDLLLELDPTEASAEQQAQREALDADLAEIARRRFAIRIVRTVLNDPAKWVDANARGAKSASLARAAADPEPQIDWRAELPEIFRLREASVLTADVNQLTDTLRTLDKQMAQKAATRERLEMSIADQNKLIDTLTQLVRTRQLSIDFKVGTKINLYAAKAELEKSQSSLASNQGAVIETDAALKRLASEEIKTLSQFVADNENKLADAERKADEAKQALVKAGARLARTRFYSPIDGVVQQLAVTTVGQVVTTGQQLMVVTPSEGALWVEALVANQDIGFVKLGQSAAIKVDAFPFTRFGVLRGKIERIASEAVDEQEAKRALANTPASANASGAAATQPGQPESFVFPVAVALEQQAITVAGTAISLTPGMTVTVDIKTGTRRVIDYLLSPLSRIASDAMKER